VSRVLIIEDDPAVGQGLLDNLTFEGLAVELASCAESGLARLREGGFGLLLLDLMLPGISGYDLLRQLPELPGPPRVIVVSARDAETDIVRALDLGAHDYVRKPFGLGELLARVRAQLRELESAERAHEEDVCFGDVRISLSRFRIWRGDREALLSHTEAKIIQLFLSRPDQPLRRSEIIDTAWHPDAYPTERTVDNFILKLRKKLEEDPAHPRILRTVHGIGYRFAPPE
jgi:DNA-binding response OmpR family regulator